LSNSLIVSLLLLCALVIVLVLVAELFRAWRLRQDRVAVPVESPRARGREASSPQAVGPRQEPEFDGLTVPAAQRIEPDFGLIAVSSGRADRVDPQLDAPRAQSWGGALGEPREPDRSGPDRAAAQPPAKGTDREDAAALAAQAPEATGRSTAPATESRPATPTPLADLARTGPFPSSDSVSTQGGASETRDPRVVDTGLKPTAAAVAMPAHELATAAERLDTAASERGAGHAIVQPGPLAGALPLTVLSSFTDCIIDLACAAPAPGERLIALSQAFRRCGTKPVTVEVAVPGPDGAGGRTWRAPHPLDACRALRIGILLDNRSGPLNAMEFSEFLARTQELADRIGAQYKAPLMTEVLQAARRLDTDCAQLDCTASVNVEAEEALGPAQFASLAGPLAIIERGNHRYARMTADGEAVFSVTLGDRPNRLSFLLDLPRVSSPISAWQQMVECARVASRRLPGRLVDSGGRPLTDRLIDSSAAHVRQRAFALEAAGLKPGSPLALRVFNG
jgi:hypothetical protein